MGQAIILWPFDPNRRPTLMTTGPTPGLGDQTFWPDPLLCLSWRDPGDRVFIDDNLSAPTPADTCLSLAISFYSSAPCEGGQSPQSTEASPCFLLICPLVHFLPKDIGRKRRALLRGFVMVGARFLEVLGQGRPF